MKRVCILAEAPERRGEAGPPHLAASVWGEEPPRAVVACAGL